MFKEERVKKQLVLIYNAFRALELSAIKAGPNKYIFLNIEI
jgi:hypothetical protein